MPCSEGDAVPTRPIPVTPVFPTVHQTEGKANLTQLDGIIEEHIHMDYIYDYPRSRMLEWWRSNDKQYPYPNATAHFNGTRGTYDIYDEKI